MRKRISFLILSNTGSPVRNVTLSKALLCFLSLSFTACILFVGFVIYDYCNLRLALVNNKELERNIANLSDEIVSQRKQIQMFAGQINTLKSKLIDLNSFEEKIRIIANIEETNDQDSLFGVGGSVPDDIDPQVPLTNKHHSLIREMHEQTQQLDHASLKQRERFETLLKYFEEHRNLLASTPAIRPTQGWTTSGFGYRISPFTGLREFHKGLDIATRKGSPIIVTADGTITYVGKKGFFGKMIVVDHGHGMVTRYAHIDKALIKIGDAVMRGDSIALVGTSGRTTGPHLHYEVHLNGMPVNPNRYILN